MQKLKLKDYLQMHLNKIFDLEVLEGDLVYFGKEIKAKNKEVDKRARFVNKKKINDK